MRRRSSGGREDALKSDGSGVADASKGAQLWERRPWWRDEDAIPKARPTMPPPPPAAPFTAAEAPPPAHGLWLRLLAPPTGARTIASWGGDGIARTPRQRGCHSGAYHRPNVQLHRSPPPGR